MNMYSTYCMDAYSETSIIQTFNYPNYQLSELSDYRNVFAWSQLL